jgi:hypothetical protein
MKKYREDPENVYREDRLKRIRSIRSGIIPRPTMQKYQITPTEVNQEREQAGLKKTDEDELEPYPIESAKTIAIEINRKTKADLIKKAEQAYLKLKQNRKELMKTQEERNQREIQRANHERAQREFVRDSSDHESFCSIFQKTPVWRAFIRG